MEKTEFKQALDVFGQFFVAPLMKENTVEREINAVDSEFDLAKQNDWCRCLFTLQVRDQIENSDRYVEDIKYAP